MDKKNNPHRKTRGRIALWYLSALAVFFLFSVFFFALEGLTGLAFFQNAGLCTCFVLAILTLLLVPLLIYLVLLTEKARALDRQRERAEKEAGRPPLPPRTDSVGAVIPAPSKRGSIPVYPGFAKKETGPWWSVIALTLMLPPLGFILILYKTSAEPHKYLENALVLKATGYVLGGLSLFLFCLAPALGADNPAALRLFLIFPALLLGMAAVLLIVGFHIGRKARIIALCQKLIFIEAELRVDRIAACLKKSYGETIQLLQRLIDKGYLFSCYIDFKNREVASPDQLPKVAKKCRFCGGTTVFIQGLAGVCDFCGRVIK